LTHSGRKAIKGDGVNRREPEQELARLHAAAVYDTAQFEEKQNNRPHATKLYRRLVEEYFRFPLRESGEDPFGESALAQKNLHAKVNNSGLTLLLSFAAAPKKRRRSNFTSSDILSALVGFVVMTKAPFNHQRPK
jgi:hypothetical protein